MFIIILLGNCVLYEIHEKNYKSSWTYFKQRRDNRRLYLKLYQQVLLGTTNQTVSFIFIIFKINYNILLI